MRQELIESLKPIVEGFVDRLLGVHAEFLEKNNELSRQLGAVEEHINQLKEQAKENAKIHRAGMDKVVAENDRFVTLQEGLQEEISQYTQKNNELRKIKDENEQTLKNTKAENELAVQRRVDVEKIIKEYQLKIDSLKTDSELLDKRKRELDDAEVKLKAKDRALLAREEKQAQSEYELSVRELNIRQKEKQVKLELKRAGLND